MSSLRTFYLLNISQILSMLGTRMTGVAVGIWIFAQTGDATPILFTAFFNEVPQVFGGLLSGLLADKWDRRYVIMLGDAGQALGTILLLISILTGTFQIWMLYAIVFLQGIFVIVQEPAVEASTFMLVPEERLDHANGIRQIAYPLAGALAAAPAAIIYSLAGLQGVIVVDLLTFVLSIAVVFFLSIPMPSQSDEDKASGASFWEIFWSGWNFLRRRQVLLIVVIYQAILFFLIYGPLETIIPYLSSLTDSEIVLGILLTMFNVGAFGGGLFVAFLGAVPNRMHWILLAYLVNGILLIAFGLSRNPWLIGISIFGAMFPLPFASALFNSILQTKTPSDMQGRIFAISSQIFYLTVPFSYLLTAYLVDHVLEPAVGQAAWENFTNFVGKEAGAGMSLLFVIVGIIIVLLTLGMLLWPAARKLESTLPSYSSSNALVTEKPKRKIG